jgi:hypothetical protein
MKTKVTKVEPQPEKRRVQTVKLTDDQHFRLSSYGLKTRRSNQDIMENAIEEYLAKHS